jgi:hypothetical protein
MTTYKTYQAAVERLRDSVENAYVDQHGNRFSCQSVIDKAIIYDALHDATPATVEWLREIACESKIVSGTGWSRTVYYGASEKPFASVNDGVVSLVGLARPVNNPTRGQVLMLLSVFNERND